MKWLSNFMENQIQPNRSLFMTSELTHHAELISLFLRW